MKKVHLLYTMALLSLSATGRLYCAAEKNDDEVPAWLKYASDKGLPMASSTVYNLLTPEEQAKVDAERERLKSMGKAGAVVGGALTAGAVLGAAYNMLPSRDQAYNYFSKWMPDPLKKVAKPSAARMVDGLITGVLYSTDFMKEAQWSKSFRWMLEQIANKNNQKVISGFIELIQNLKYFSSKGADLALDTKEDTLKEVFTSMGAKPSSSWFASISMQTDYNTVELYRTESLAVPGKLTGKQIVNQLITDLETTNPNVFNFLYE